MLQLLSTLLDTGATTIAKWYTYTEAAWWGYGCTKIKDNTMENSIEKYTQNPVEYWGEQEKHNVRPDEILSNDESGKKI